jgi:hypothetical protein
MQIFTWKACICGLFQVAFLYQIKVGSWYFEVLPVVVYLVLEIGKNLMIVFNDEYLTQSKTIEYLIYLATLGLCLTSALLFAEAKDAGLDTSPALVPLFMIFIMHSVCRVLQDPPLFLAPLINLLAPPLAVCTMTGTCNSFYLSVFSSFFGAFGSSFVDFFEVLKPLTYVLLLITVLSVYTTHKMVCYAPFILACFSCAVIISGELLQSIILITGGNLLLVGSVIWNNRKLKIDEWKSV